MSEQRPKIGRNIITTYVARFSNVIGLFFLFPLVSSQLGASAYGVYLLTTSVATLFTTDLGMAGATTRYVAQATANNDINSLKKIVASSTLFFLIVGCAASLVVSCVFVFGWPTFDIPMQYRSAAATAAAIVAGQTIVGSALSVNKNILAGAGRLDLSNWMQVGQLAFRVLVTVAALLINSGIIGIVIADTAAVVLGGFGMWIVRRVLVPQSVAKLKAADWPTFRSMFRLSIDLLFISLSALVILQSGNLIVSLVLPIAYVAVYGAGFRIYQVCRELTNSLTAALLPAATDQHVRGQYGANQRLYLVGTRYANALVQCVTVPIIVYSAVIMEAWVGAELAAGAVVAQVLVASMLINNNHLVAIPILTGQGNVRAYAGLHVVWALSSIILGFSLTKIFGVEGMALATALPVVVLEPVYVWIALRRLNLRVATFMSEVVLRTFGIAFPLAIVVFGLAQLIFPHADLWSAGIVSVIWVLAYLALFARFGTTKGDRARAFELVRQLRPKTG